MTPMATARLMANVSRSLSIRPSWAQATKQIIAVNLLPRRVHRQVRLTRNLNAPPDIFRFGAADQHHYRLAVVSVMQRLYRFATGVGHVTAARELPNCSLDNRLRFRQDAAQRQDEDIRRQLHPVAPPSGSDERTTREAGGDDP